MKNALPAVTCLVVVISFVGCAAQTASVAIPPLESQADYNRLFAAASDVIATRFEIAKAERDTGVIETGWLVGPASQTGFKLDTAPGEAGDDAVKTYRRRAVVNVKHSGADPLSVTVARERLVRDHPAVEPRGTFDARLPMELVQGVGTTWKPEGNDKALVAIIAREIAAKYTGK